MAGGSRARIAEMSAPTRASPRRASVQARRSSSLGRKESFDRANRQLRTSPKQDARSSVPSICFLTLAPSRGDVSSPSASSLNRAKMRASRAASSSVYDDTGGCGAPGSGRSVWDCCCWGAALAEYQLLGALLRRVQRAAPRAALRRALADVSMARPSPAVRRLRGAILAAIVAAIVAAGAPGLCQPLRDTKPYIFRQRADQHVQESRFKGVIAALESYRDGCNHALRRCAFAGRGPCSSTTSPTRETSQRRPRSYWPVFVRVRLGSGRPRGTRDGGERPTPSTRRGTYSTLKNVRKRPKSSPPRPRRP